MQHKYIFKALDYTWRFLATCIAFAVFGLGSLLLGGVIIPFIIPLVSRGPEMGRRRVRKAIHYTFKFFFGFMDTLGLLRYKIVDSSLIENDQGCIIVANHPSLVDVIAIIALYPNACCIVKQELWNNFFIKRVVCAAGYIPNDEPTLLLKNCEESLARGDVLIVFPEGTRTAPGAQPLYQRGAAHIALRLKRSVRVMRIDVYPHALTKGLPWYRIPPRRVDFTVTVKSQIFMDSFLKNELPLSLASRRLTKAIEDNIGLV